MIRRSRGVIFGTQGASRGQQSARIGTPTSNSYTAQANASTQFGRTQGRRPIFGRRTTRARR